MNTMQRPGGDTARLFLALWPDDALRRALLWRRDAWLWPVSTVLVPPENFHLTLHFLGNVPISRLPELTELAPGLGVPCEPFALSLGHAELWPHGIAVLKPDEPDEPDAVPPPLAQLHEALQLALTRLALPTENRAYRPHITLARHAQAAVPPTRGPALR
ncbi:MAG: RNA 2',3'-cyclic phosphodiesterase [Polaromonas sp.]